MEDAELRTILKDLARDLLRRLEHQPPPNLTPGQLAILNALTHEPQSSRRVARLARRTWNSAFRQQLRDLVSAGLARRTARGYSRA